MKYRFQFFLINLGIKLLPKEFRNKEFIDNCIFCNYIKLEGDE